MSESSSLASVCDPRDRVRYQLPVRPQSSGTKLFLDDRGVTLDGGNLSWSRDGETRSQPLAELRDVQLTVRPMKSGPVPECRLGFADATSVTVVASTRLGSPDPDLRRVYAEFLRDLHARLDAGMRTQIQFGAGLSQDRVRKLTIVSVVGAVATFLLVVLSLAAKEMRGLLLAVGSASMTWRAMSSVEANRPTNYDPNAIPETMIPQ